jgi:hypothetical protein
MIAKHLVHHALCLAELAGLGRLVDLIDRRIRRNDGSVDEYGSSEKDAEDDWLY